MLASFEERKFRAVTIMEKMKIDKKVILHFIKNNIPAFFDHSRLSRMPGDVLNIVKDFERDYGSTVYAVTTEHFSFGLCHTLLYVSKYSEDWEKEFVEHINVFFAYAYVYNKTFPYNSDVGRVSICSFYGNLRRMD